MYEQRISMWIKIIIVKPVTLYTNFKLNLEQGIGLVSKDSNMGSRSRFNLINKGGVHTSVHNTL